MLSHLSVCQQRCLAHESKLMEDIMELKKLYVSLVLKKQGTCEDRLWMTEYGNV